MARGVFLVSGVNTLITTRDNSCKSVREALDLYYWDLNIGNRKTLACSADPVVVLTKIYSSTSASVSVTQEVQDMTATQFKKMDWFDTAHLLQALLIVGFVMMFVRGFDSGNKL